MTRSPLAAATLALAAATPAQWNDVERRNPGVLWVEAQKHPVTRHCYPDIRQNPAAHTTAAGVPRGTLSYVWIPRETNHRDEDESIDGFRAALGPSSATVSYPVTLYYPELTLHRTRQVGNHVEPDPGAPPYLVIPEAPLVFGRFGFFVTESNLSAPYVLGKQQTDVVLSLKWNRNDSRDQPNTLQMSGDAAAATAIYQEPVFGFVSPGGVTTPVSMGAVPDPGFLNFTYRRATPTINARTSWVDPMFPANPTTPYNIAGYAAPVVTQAGAIAWDVAYGPAHAGQVAVGLFNLGPFFPASTAFLGEVFELDFLDPNIALLVNAGYILTLDSSGTGVGPAVNIPKLTPASLGLRMGAEFAVFNPTFTALEDTTQSAWIEIAR